MAENKLSPQTKVLITVIILFALAAALNVAGHLSSLKNNPPVAVQPTEESTIISTLTPTPTPVPTVTVSNENFKIAYSLDDGIYIANSDGTSARKVFDCPIYKTNSNGTCSVPFWLKDGRLISNITNGKRIDVGQDFIDDMDLAVIDVMNNNTKIISRPKGYNNYNWNSSANNFIIQDPLVLTQKGDSNKYYLFNPDKGSVASISRKEVTVSDKSYFYFPDDTLTYDYGDKSENIPNKNGDILLISHGSSCQVTVYNVNTKEAKDIFDNCDKDKVIIITDKKYELLDKDYCKLSRDSSYVACSMEDFAHVGGDRLILLVDLKNNNKIVLPYSHWSFQFSPDSQYLYMGSLPDGGIASISRYNIVNKSLENVISYVRSSADVSLVFSLSPSTVK